MKNIGIVIETDNGKIKEAVWGMIAMARGNEIELFAFVLDADVNVLKKDLESFGILKIVDISLAKDQQSNPVVKTKALINAIKEFNINALFGLSTAEGKDILPRVAAMLDSPLVMDCIDVDLEQNSAKTSQYSGKTIATIKLSGDVLLFGVRPNSVEPIKVSAAEKPTAEIIQFDCEGLYCDSLKVINTMAPDQSARINLVEANIIITGGRGMKNKENFTMLFQCAKKLNAAVGASRVAVDSGWAPYSMQVGQTGEKVSPKVYIACGISGSIQHFAGMKTSGIVIAINTDENAAIMSNCDYYVMADALNIIPELTKLLTNG